MKRNNPTPQKQNGLQEQFRAKKETAPAPLNYPLEPQEAMFIANYLKHFDMVQAVKDTGLARSNNTSKAKRLGEEMLARDHVQAALAEAVDDKVKRTLVTADKIICQLAKIAFFDPKEMYDASGNMLSLQDMPAHVRASIHKLQHKTMYAGQGSNSVRTGYITDVETYNRLNALQLLAKMINEGNGTPTKDGDTNINLNYYDNRRQTAAKIDLRNLNAEEVKVLKRLFGAEDNPDQEAMDLREIEEWSLQQR